MLDNSDTLLALAEIAATFTGFAALVSVIRPGPRPSGQVLHDLLRLRLVIASSVAGVAGALIPVGLAGYGLDADLIWRVASALLLIMGYGIIIALVGSYRRVTTEFDPDRPAVVVVTSIELIEQVSLLIVLLGVPFGNPAALYVTALIGNLCQAGFVFVRFVGSTFRRESRPARGA
ncbi:MAG: hypothetical protein R3195_03685 [Gemmatimonadota bacterium]|nr:hypothetical protein [Gemmatimonadota bacterium]